MDLERTLRDTFRDRAGLVDPTVPLVRLAQQGAARRRRAAIAAVAGVSALVVVAGLAGTFLHRADHDAAGSAVITERSSLGGRSGFRLEVWHDVGVYVPADWGWGSSPSRSQGCASGATVASDGHRMPRPDLTMPYVGRPIGWPGARRCAPAAAPRVPFVWLGAGTPRDLTDSVDGWRAETRKVGSTTVTVYSDDAELRQTVLASAHVLKSACPAATASPPSVSSVGPDAFSPAWLTVCAYAADDADTYRLLYKTELPANDAKGLAPAVAAAPELGSFSCFAGRGGEWVLLRAATGTEHRDYVVDMQCPSIAGPDGVQHRLTDPDVLPWALNGVSTVLHDSPLIELSRNLFTPAR